MSQLTRFGVSVPDQLVEAFDNDIVKKGYRTRSEAIRDIMRARLVERQWEAGDQEVVGTVTVIYNHHSKRLTSILTSLQHEHHDEVLCTTHVHLDHNNCLEVVILKGTGERVRDIAHHLIGTKGVKHGRLVCTTTGQILK